MEHDAATYADALPPARQHAQTDHAKIAPVMPVLHRRQGARFDEHIVGAWLSYGPVSAMDGALLSFIAVAPREGNRAVGATSRG